MRSDKDYVLIEVESNGQGSVNAHNELGRDILF